jgi:hypothetical protein
MWYSNLEKTFISRLILHQRCPIALPVRRNTHSHFRTCSGIIWDFRMFLREFLDPVVNRFTRLTLPTVNRKDLFINILWIKSCCAQKRNNITLLFGSINLKHGRHFDSWNQPLTMRMCVCYLDCHEAGLCCYLVIHMENLLSITAVLLPFVTYLLTFPRVQLNS